MQAIIYIFVGGGLGSICRYLVGQNVSTPGNGFPTKTFLANVLSCIVLGFLLGYFTKHHLDEKYKLLLMTGFCGGFSTFSTFSAEVFQLIDNSQIAIAIMYIISSVIICTLLLFGTYLLAQQL